jgi:hypothetical protein
VERRARHTQSSYALLLVALVASVRALAAPGTISLEWRPTLQTVSVGETVGIGLYAVSDSGEPEQFSAVQAVIAWDNEHLLLMGTDESGAIGLFSSGFPAGDAYNLNETSPPADGDGLWVGLAFPDPLPATPEGSLLTTVLFEALAPTSGAWAEILPNGGNPPAW